TTVNNNQYTVTVNYIDDQNGETNAANSKVKLSVFGTYGPGDVVINEFMYDEPPDQSEYIEIKNSSDKLLNLQGWQVGDNSNLKNISASALELEPHSLLVLTADSSKLFTVYGARAYVEIDGLPGLNNSGDAIRLLTAKGVRADSFTYQSGWGGQEIALERRSGSVSGTYPENWGNSPHPDGGTPGRPNQVASDDQPPKISGLTISDSQTVRISFTERVNSSSAGDSDNYMLTDATISSAAAIAPDSVSLSLANPLQNAHAYTLEISGITDIFGNTAKSDTTFTYYKVSPADSGDVAINEFLFDPPSGSAEYIELYNHSDKSLDLQQWTLSDNRHAPVSITDKPFVLPPDSFVVLASDRSLHTSYPHILLISLPEFPALNNSGDQIIIRDDTGQLLDSLSYDSNWGGAQKA